MSDGSTLLVTPCKLPSTNFPALMKTKSPGLKRTISDLDVQSCLSSSIVIRSRTKRRRCIAWDERPSKIRWNSVLEEQRGDNGECRLHAVADNEKWYSKAEYKQMLMDQCCTVRIMRSLRSITGETVPIDCGDESDCNYNHRRFDEIIKQHLVDPEDYCERGLESYLSDERRNEINATRKLHKLLVIGEYGRQGMLGSSNPDLVRSISLTLSVKSSIRAQKLALIDQQEARVNSNTKNKEDVDQKRDRRQNQTLTQPTNTIIDREIEAPPSPPLKRKGMILCSDNKIHDHNKHHPLDHIHRNETRAALEEIRDTLMKQHLLHLLSKHQQEQNQRAQSAYHLNRTNLHSIPISDDSSMAQNLLMVKSMLASSQIQEQKRLLHQNHHQQLQQQHQLQNQCNYQQQVQRLLLLQQHQQRYESVQLAGTNLLG